MNEFNSIAEAMRTSIQKDLRESAARDAARPIGEIRVDIDFYDRKKDSIRPVDEAKWCAVLVKWSGYQWKRYRRMTGPENIDIALSNVTRIARQRGLERV